MWQRDRACGCTPLAGRDHDLTPRTILHPPPVSVRGTGHPDFPGQIGWGWLLPWWR